MLDKQQLQQTSTTASNKETPKKLKTSRLRGDIGIKLSQQQPENLSKTTASDTKTFPQLASDTTKLTAPIDSSVSMEMISFKL